MTAIATTTAPTRADAIAALDTLARLFPIETVALHVTCRGGVETYTAHLFGFFGDPTPLLPFLTDALLGPEVDGCREFTARICGVAIVFSAGRSAAAKLIAAGIAHQERRVEVFTVPARAPDPASAA